MVQVLTEVELRARHVKEQRRYLDRHPARTKAAARRYYLKNKERNREAQRARSKAYRLRRPPMWMRSPSYAWQANARAAKLDCEGRLKTHELRAIKGPCAYCFGEARSWDHVVPLAQGGANAAENLVPCCGPCNRSKGTRTPEEWLAL